MIDEIGEDFEDLEGPHRIPVKISLDEDGYYDRQCPADSCGAEFKILYDDWENIVTDEVVYCPVCRFQAEASEWHTQAQMEYFEAVAVDYFTEKLDRALENMARRFNERQPRGLVSVSMSYTPGDRQIILPIQAAEAFTQRYKCEECNCHYSSIGVAFFCPACGHNCVPATFDDTLDTVRTSLSSLSSIAAALEKHHGKDIARTSTRLLIENQFAGLVGAFQRLSEGLYEKLRNPQSYRKNAFQNLREGSDLWRSACSKGYDDLIAPDEFKNLERNFLRRHVLVHCNGIVDQEYIDKAGDTEYRVGQRLVITADAVIDFTRALQKLAKELRKLA